VLSVTARSQSLLQGADQLLPSKLAFL